AARLEYGVELMLEPLDLREVVRETVRGVEETFADQPSPTLITEMPAGPVTVLADREQLSTVVANLVRNAMRFSPEHSEVRCIVAARGGVVGAVTVTDHGPGIPAEQVGRLFTASGASTFRAPPARGVRDSASTWRASWPGCMGATSPCAPRWAWAAASRSPSRSTRAGRPRRDRWSATCRGARCRALPPSLPRWRRSRSRRGEAPGSADRPVGR